MRLSRRKFFKAESARSRATKSKLAPTAKPRSLKQDWRASLRQEALLLLALLACNVGYASAVDLALLNSLSPTRIGRIEKFVAADAFRVGNRIGSRTLSLVGPNFTQYFIAVVEKDVPATSLSRWTLNYTTGDKSLIKSLGGEDQAVLPFLAYVYQLMEMGEQGAGHTDWRSNFAYIRSPVDQRLWAVHWTVNYENEWTIGAVNVPHPDLDWPAGSALFSGEPVDGTAQFDAQASSEISPRRWPE